MGAAGPFLQWIPKKASGWVRAWGTLPSPWGVIKSIDGRGGGGREMLVGGALHETQAEGGVRGEDGEGHAARGGGGGGQGEGDRPGRSGGEVGDEGPVGGRHAEQGSESPQTARKATVGSRWFASAQHCAMGPTEGGTVVARWDGSWPSLAPSRNRMSRGRQSRCRCANTVCQYFPTRLNGWALGEITAVRGGQENVRGIRSMTFDS